MLKYLALGPAASTFQSVNLYDLSKNNVAGNGRNASNSAICAAFKSKR